MALSSIGLTYWLNYSATSMNKNITVSPCTIFVSILRCCDVVRRLGVSIHLGPDTVGKNLSRVGHQKTTGAQVVEI